jgi:hypothetical protein
MSKENHRTLSELAERLIECPSFEYRPGMAILRMSDHCNDEPIRIVAVTATSIDLFVPGADLQRIGVSERPVVDISDPATFGILVAQFLNHGGSSPDSNPFWLAVKWSSEATTPDRLVDAFEYDKYLPF